MNVVASLVSPTPSSEWSSDWLPEEFEAEALLRFEEPQRVELHARAWVPGTRVEAYFGPVSAEIFLKDCEVQDRCSAWSAAQTELLERLRDRAFAKRANAVIGLEMILDPFARCPRSGASGLYLLAVGTAAKLERI